jgi:alpha-glucoside transport system substrate-binding protein
MHGTAPARRPGRRFAPAVALLLLFASCRGAGGPGAAAALRGRRIEVLAVWSGAEQAQFERVIRAFEAQTGAEVTYTSAGHGVPDVLAARLAQGRPPDVAFLPQPGVLRQYAATGHLVPLEGIAGDAVSRNYAPVWRQLASAGGHLYGVWFKAANKSLIWYDVGVFEQAGVVPPVTLDGLLRVARRLNAGGRSAFSVAGADGWTLTDWFENLYLRTAGPRRYDELAGHRIPWTDATVKSALTLMSSLLSANLIDGGTAGALKTHYQDSVVNVFGPASSAAMVFEGDFVEGAISSQTRAELGVDADAFAFPSPTSDTRPVVGGGDVAVLMRQSVVGAAFLRYLATPAAAAIWASRGGFVSPNLNVDLSVYPDATTRAVARDLLEAGDEFRFDLSDLQPANFGGTETSGMRKVLRDFLTTRDVDGTAAALEAAARAAYGS